MLLYAAAAVTAADYIRMVCDVTLPAIPDFKWAHATNGDVDNDGWCIVTVQVQTSESLCAVLGPVLSCSCLPIQLQLCPLVSVYAYWLMPSYQRALIRSPVYSHCTRRPQFLWSCGAFG